MRIGGVSGRLAPRRWLLDWKRMRRPQPAEYAEYRDSRSDASRRETPYHWTPCRRPIEGVYRHSGRFGATGDDSCRFTRSWRVVKADTGQACEVSTRPVYGQGKQALSSSQREKSKTIERGVREESIDRSYRGREQSFDLGWGPAWSPVQH